MTIALVDCNAFFCSCERVFEPKLRGVPVVVLSNNDGCAIARTTEAKALGIGMGDPYFKFRALAEKHNVAVYSSNFSLYTDMSRRVMKLLRQFSPRVEVYSVDEAFIDLSGIPNPLEYARLIKREVEKQTKIAISIGVAKTKVLSKIACRVGKKDPATGGVVCLLEPDVVDLALKKVPVDKIWGIARGRSLKLKLLGLKTAYDFKQYKNEKKIQKELTKIGRGIHGELNGIINFPLVLSPEKKKEVMSSRSFPHPVYDLPTLRESIAGHASSVAEELRSQHSVCTEVLVYIRSNPFKEGSVQYGRSVVKKFLTPTSNTFKIIKMAFECLDEIYKPGIEYKKAGVRVMTLQDKTEHKLNLFEASDTRLEDELMKTMDKINHREGPRTLQSLACGTKEFSWQMSRKRLSPRYTTSWNALPKCY